MAVHKTELVKHPLAVKSLFSNPKGKMENTITVQLVKDLAMVLRRDCSLPKEMQMPEQEFVFPELT